MWDRGEGFSCAVVGFGDAYATDRNRKTALQLAAEAVRGALSSAGVGRDDIGGLLTGRSPMADPREQWNVILASQLGLTPSYTTQVMNHSSGVVGMFLHAYAALHARIVDYVLCVQADAAPLFVDASAAVTTLDADPEYEVPFGATPIAMYAMQARRYMAETAATERDFARVAVAAQAWAVAHPFAHKAAKGLITEETVLRSRRIADPLKLWDCAPWGPGGTAGAFILTRLDLARSLTDRPIHLRGAASSLTHQYFGERVAQILRSKKLAPSAGRVASRQAYDAAGLGPLDVDVVCPSTAFTPMGLIALEDLGFCGPGEAGDFVADGHIAPGGDVPFNTNGGWLSFGQAGTSANMDSVIEALRQLSGTALGQQVADCRTALIHGIGGTYSCSDVAILSRELS